MRSCRKEVSLALYLLYGMYVLKYREALVIDERGAGEAKVPRFLKVPAAEILGSVEALKVISPMTTCHSVDARKYSFGRFAVSGTVNILSHIFPIFASSLLRSGPSHGTCFKPHCQSPDPPAVIPCSGISFLPALTPLHDATARRRA